MYIADLWTLPQQLYTNTVYVYKVCWQPMETSYIHNTHSRSAGIQMLVIQVLGCRAVGSSAHI